MQISCPQCATSYELDERLLPAQGAPVQCTRCSFVFNAAPPKRDANKTQIFGLPQPPPAAPATGPQAGSANGTVTGDDETREEPPPPSERTNIYGRTAPLPGAGIPSGTVQYGRPAPRTTQQFGTATSEPEEAPRKTKLFGSVGDATAPSAPEPIPRSTQIFGAFGARPAQTSPEAGPRTTQMFGSAGAATPPAASESTPHTTQMFGSAGATSPAASEPTPRTTQMFGSAGAASPPAAAEPTAHHTQMFGNAGTPPAAEPSLHTTMMFGTAGGGTPSVAPEPIPRTTQMFGTAGAEPPPVAPEPIPRTTQMFGTAGAGTPRAAFDPSPRSTQMFGSVAEAAPQPASSSGPHTTMMFGTAGTAPSGPPLSSGAQPPPRTTQRFAVPTPNALPQYDDSVPQGDDSPVPFDARATILDPMPVPVRSAAPRPAPHEARTLIGGAGPMSAATHETTGTPADGEAPTWIPSAGRRATGAAPAVEAPRPLEPFSPPSLTAPNPDASLLIDDGTTALIEARNRRRNLVLGVLALLVIGGAGYFGYDLWSKREKPPPPEAITASEKAITTLRRDDSKSLEAAVAAHEQLVARYPDFVDAHVSYLTALLFSYDDLRMQIERAKQRSDALTAQMTKLRERKAPSDWQNRVNALVDELSELKTQSDPLVDRATELDARVNAEFRAVQQLIPADARPALELQRVRAQALYFGVKGSDQAITLSERYRILGGTEGWGDIAFAEYALNTRVAPETRRQAREALEALKTQDASFVRLYVLIGRLALADKDFEKANTALESAVTLNPEHDVARALLRHLQQEQADR